MHLDEWRQANKIIHVEADIRTNTDVGALFFLAGKYSDQTWDVPVLTGIKRPLTLEDYKQASGAFSSSNRLRVLLRSKKNDLLCFLHEQLRQRCELAD